MAEMIEFRGDYTDHSTDKGFQFEFNCQRCSNGYRTRFQPSLTGNIAGALGMASNLFGSVLGRGADLANEVHSAKWEKAHDDAFQKAWLEIRPTFIQCPRCMQWVCRKSCWNDKKGLCKGCAPDLGVEMAAAQAERAVEEVHAHARMAEEDKKLSEENWRETIRASCPKCEAPLATNAKFCPECGEALKKKQFCEDCGEAITPGAKFCSGCGTKTE